MDTTASTQPSEQHGEPEGESLLIQTIRRIRNGELTMPGSSPPPSCVVPQANLSTDSVVPQDPPVTGPRRLPVMSDSGQESAATQSAAIQRIRNGELTTSSLPLLLQDPPVMQPLSLMSDPGWESIGI